MPVATPSDNQLTFRQLKQYKDLVFPACVAQEGHNPYFSLEKSYDWVTSEAVRCFKDAIGTSTAGQDTSVDMPLVDHEWETVPVGVVEAYRSFILPPQTASHEFFMLDNAENWIRNEPFRLFLLHYNASSGPSSSSVIDEPNTSETKKTNNLAIKLEPSSVALGKRKANTQDIITIISSDDDDDDEPSQTLSTTAKKQKKQKKQKKTAFNAPRAIKVTRQLVVQSVEHLYDIPTIWDVPRHSTAYIIDLSQNPRFQLGAGAGDKSKTIISWIRHEDQSSWDGSSGHKNGDANVIDLFGEGNVDVRCRRADFRCNGVKVCEFIDRGLLDGFQGWERDDTEMAPFSGWRAELEENENKEGFRQPDSDTSRNGEKTREEGKCSLILHPRSHKTHCPFTHIINSQAKQGRIQHHQPSCGSRLIIFEPIDPDIRMAIVIPKHPHNHPRPAPSSREAEAF